MKKILEKQLNYNKFFKQKQLTSLYKTELNSYKTELKYSSYIILSLGIVNCFLIFYLVYCSYH